jgi:hypothetical protein
MNPVHVSKQHLLILETGTEYYLARDGYIINVDYSFTILVRWIKIETQQRRMVRSDTKMKMSINI